MTSAGEFIQSAAREIVGRSGFPVSDIRFQTTDEHAGRVDADVSVTRQVLVESSVRVGKLTDGRVHPSHELAKGAALSDANTVLARSVAEQTLEQDMRSRPAAYANPGQTADQLVSRHLVVDECTHCKAKGKVTCSTCRGSKTVQCSRCNGHKTRACTDCESTGRSKCYTCKGTRKVDCRTCNGRNMVEVVYKKEDGSFGGSFRSCPSCSYGKVPCTACFDGRSGTCWACNGRGRRDCQGCNGNGKVNCSGCTGTGQTGCQPCEQTGHRTTAYAGSLRTTSTATYHTGSDNSGFAALVQRGRALVVDRSFRPALVGLTSDQANVSARYSWQVPFVSGVLTSSGKSYQAEIWGDDRRWVTMPPVIDDLFAPLLDSTLTGPAYFEALATTEAGKQVLREFVGGGEAVPLSPYEGMLSRDTVEVLGANAIAQIKAFTDGISTRYWLKTLLLSLGVAAMACAFVFFTKDQGFWPPFSPSWPMFAAAIALTSLLFWLAATWTFSVVSRKWVRDLTGLASASPLRRSWLAALVLLVPMLSGTAFAYWIGSDEFPAAPVVPTQPQAQQPVTPPPEVPGTSIPTSAVSREVTLPTPVSERPATLSAFAGLGGIWTGRFVCAQGVTEATLTISEAQGADAVVARLKFSVPSGSSGEFVMRGIFDPAAKSFQLRPSAWIDQPTGYRMFGVDLRPTSSGTGLEGSVNLTGCTWMRLAR